MWVKLPNESKVWCRQCTCDNKDSSHTATCEFYVDYAAALTDFVFDDEEPAPRSVKQLN